MADPYKVLGVSQSATADEIKRAYRRLAKKLHPDLNPGDKKIESQFKDATAAYDFLSDPDKRRKFDRGEIDESGQPKGPFAGGFNRSGWNSGANWGSGKREGKGFGLENEDDAFAEDLFKDIFGF